ncbi:MAG: PcfB family protein [Ruminococcus sp.]|nr:PcfB family protein [Ruminococcus sp.]
MNNGGDAAEQIVRLSLEGMEVAVKLSGSAVKNLAVILAAVLKQEQKTKGKARLTSMIRSGKELKVFTLQGKDLKKFTQEAKRYGVLYCVLKDKEQDELKPVDIIVRAEDAAKIQRIVERFELGKVDKATIVTESGEQVTENPTPALTKGSPSKQNSEQEETQHEKSSVKDKITRIKRELSHDMGNIIRTSEELTKKSDADIPAIQTKEPKIFKQEKGR